MYPIEDELSKTQKMDISFNVSRPDMNTVDSMQYDVKDGCEEGLRLLIEREYWKTIEILKDNLDYQDIIEEEINEECTTDSELPEDSVQIIENECAMKEVRTK